MNVVHAYVCVCAFVCVCVSNCGGIHHMPKGITNLTKPKSHTKPKQKTKKNKINTKWKLKHYMPALLCSAMHKGWAEVLSGCGLQWDQATNHLEGRCQALFQFD